MLRAYTALAERLRADRGAEAVEFALVIPLLLLFFLGILTFASVFNRQITLTQAAREGARLTAICGQAASCLSGVKTDIEQHAPGVTIADGDIAITACPATNPAGGTPPSATVVITYVENLGIEPLTAGVTLHGTASTPCGG